LLLNAGFRAAFARRFLIPTIAAIFKATGFEGNIIKLSIKTLLAQQID